MCPANHMLASLRSFTVTSTHVGDHACHVEGKPYYDVVSCAMLLQVQNATTVYVRRPGNPKKWRASVICVAKQCDLALMTVEEEGFWTSDLKPLQFMTDVPELQVIHPCLADQILSLPKGLLLTVVVNKSLLLIIMFTISCGSSIKQRAIVLTSTDTSTHTTPSYVL